jgi:hypothetical protein
MDWQDIKDAPRDGSCVELKRQSGFTIRAQWIDLPSCFRSGPQWWSSELGSDPKLVDVGLDRVTHFRRID